MAEKDELRRLINEVAADAEADLEHDQDQDTLLPEQVTVTRPGRARSKVLQVRLNPEEFEAIERIAARRELPASTVARERLLQMITEDEDEPDVAAMIGLMSSTLTALEATLKGRQLPLGSEPVATTDA